MQLRRLSSADADFQEKFSALVAVDASVDPEITRRAEAIVEDVRKNVHLVQYLFIKVLFQK